MRTFVRRSGLLPGVGCLALLAVATALLPGWSQEESRKKATTESEPPRPPTLADLGVIPQARLVEARNAVELLEAQLEVQKACVREAEARFKGAKEQLAMIESAAQAATVPQTRLAQARVQVEALQAEVKVKLAEQRVAEVRLNHARQHLARLQGTKEKDGAKPEDKEKSALMEARLKAARRTYELLIAAWQREAGGTSDPEQVYLWSRRWLDAQRGLADKQADHAAALEAHWNRMKELEKLAHKLHQAGVVRNSTVTAAEFYRLEAELWLQTARKEEQK